MTCTIHRHGVLVAKSRNFRGILDYARKSPVERIDCQHLRGDLIGTESVYPVTFFFDNGAIGQIDFADWRVLSHTIRNRRSWDVQRFTGYAPFVDAMTACTS